MVATVVGAVYQVSLAGISVLMELVITLMAFVAHVARPDGQFRPLSSPPMVKIALR